LAPEMQIHMPRWNENYSTWQIEVQEMIGFTEARLGYVWQHYMEEFNLEKLVDVNLDIDSSHHGSIKINTIIPDSLPWQGKYFDGNPIEINAIGDSGYIFSHWASNSILSGSDTLLSTVKINVDTSDYFKAYFEPHVIIVDTPMIVFNELNYRSSDSLDADDWIEIWNIDTIAIDLSDWVFKDSNDSHEFILSQNTSLDTGDFLVLCQDTVKFKEIYPAVENYIGPFEFGLANEGEELRLFDSNGFLMISMLYANEPPWPVDADGTGKTIELNNPLGDMNDGNNWFSGCFGGSPGGPFIPCDTIGIEDHVVEDFLVKIYPNPALEYAKIEMLSNSPGDAIFKLFDFRGVIQEKLTFKLNNKVNTFNLPVGDLPSGIYFYQTYFNKNLKGGKILIK